MSLNTNRNDNLEQSRENNAEQTDVLGDNNVSRETSTDSSLKESYKHSEKKKELDEVRKKGGIIDDDPFDFDNPRLRELYRDFRNNDLSRFESGFNALYLWCYDNYYSSGVPIKNKYKNIYAHPSSWFKNASHMWKHNKWSVIVKALDVVPAISRRRQEAKRKRQNIKKSLWWNFEHSHGSSSKAMGLVVLLLSLTGIFAAGWFFADSINSNLYGRTPALELHIDGVHVGNVLSVSDAEMAKNNAEKSISQSIRRSYSIDCDVSYKTTTIEKGTHMNAASIERSFKESAHDDMKTGYALYYYDTLITVAEQEAWLTGSMEENLLLRMPEYKQDGESENVYFNNFSIQHGAYPEQCFDSLDDIRRIFSLPPIDSQTGTAVIQNDESGVSDYLNVSDKTSLLVGGSAGTSSDVGIDGDENSGDRLISIETVKTKTITLSESIPYGTDYLYDENMAENRFIIQSKGKNGSKSVSYLAKYIDNKEVSRKMLNETIITQPVNEVIIKGTRPLTAEELQTKSTGSYIYPSSGPLSSGYSWRSWGNYNEFHKGIDIRSVNAEDLIIVASDGGRVIRSGNKGDGYGLCVLIEHDDGTVTRYAHCSQLVVKEGDKVAQGQQIGVMGRTGQATGVHVHFEIISSDGTILNPMDYLPQK